MILVFGGRHGTSITCIFPSCFTLVLCFPCLLAWLGWLGFTWLGWMTSWLAGELGWTQPGGTPEGVRQRLLVFTPWQGRYKQA